MGRASVIVQLKEFRTGPAIRGVEGDEYGKISNDADSFQVRFAFQCRPLPVKQVLNKSVIVDFIRCISSDLFQCCAFPEAEWGTPFVPGLPVMLRFENHEQAEIIEP